MKKLTITAICLLILFQPITANTFLYQALKKNMGIHSAGMGDAFTAVAMGGASIYYNPAGLARPGGLISNENLDYDSAVYQKSEAQFMYFSPFGISQLKKESINGHSLSMTTFGLGKRGSNGVDWGINYKNIQYEAPSSDGSSGWSSDLGILAHIMPFMDYGITVRDIFKHNVSIPTTFSSGISFFTPSRSLIVSTEIECNRENEKTKYIPHYGVSYAVSDGLILRAGSYKDYYTGGVSINLPFVRVDYSLVQSQKNAHDTIYMLGFKLGKGVQIPQQRRRASIIKSNAIAEVPINQSLVSGKSEFALLSGYKIGANDILTMIHQASNDPTCEGYVLKISPVTNSLSSLGLIQEIRTELEKSKKKGKRIVAYIENWATLPEYYLASIADEIVIPELGTISHLGINLEVLKTKTFLNNFGIGAKVIKSGAHKTALLPLSEKMTDEDQVIYEDLVQGLYHQVLFDIKQSRGLKWEDISSVFDGRLITAKEAKDKGLIDKIGFFDTAKKIAKKPDPDTTKKKTLQSNCDIVALSDFYIPPGPPTIFSAFNRIAVIEIDGMIAQKGGQNLLFSHKNTGAEDIERLVDQIKKDFTIKGVILRVNSPGGGILASDQIYYAIEKLKKAGKKVYTSMGNIAASGGYYVAMNSDKIIANPGTLTGSIGVFSIFQNFENLHKMLGISRKSIKTGKHMDLLSINKDLNAEEIEILENYQNQHYQSFVAKIKHNRQLTDEEAIAVAQGQVITGKKAKDLKMVDELGNFYDAVDALSKEIKVENPELVFYRKKKPLLFHLLNRQLFSQVFGG